jgi:molybdopterin synthase catalytic subunit
MTVRVLFFAYLRDVTGSPAIDLELPAGSRVADAHAAVVARWPALDTQLVRIPIVLDGRVVEAMAPLTDGAELAWLPPVGGGAGDVPPAGLVVAGVTGEPLDLARLIAEVGAPNCGGIASFLGVVRGDDGGRPVVALEYEAYASMAREQVRAVVLEALARWPMARIAVLHRTGRVAVGEPSVAIAVACPHRAEAFDCCRHVIDRVKEAVPVWKREHGPDGAPARWLPGHAWRPADAPPEPRG